MYNMSRFVSHSRYWKNRIGAILPLERCLCQSHAGCTHCQLLKQSFEAVEGDDRAHHALDESGKWTSTDFRIVCSKTGSGKWRVKCVFIFTDYRLTFEIFGVQNQANVRELVHATDKPLQQASANSVKVVWNWIADCAGKHEQCGPGKPKQLPRRILDLGGSNDSKVFLIEPDAGMKDRYVCQSYCWGLSRTVITMKNTLLTHKSGIDISYLPRTFRDTIEFTKLLGLRYLWIDSLCIIQDSVDDWRAEAAKMASYYGNAYLTIAATMSTSADGGLFQTPLSRILTGPTQTCEVRAHRHLQTAKSPLFTRG